MEPLPGDGGRILDMAWGPSGDSLFLLVSVIPHIVVATPDGSVARTLDLPEVRVPGGMARLPGSGGFVVSDPLGDGLLRYSMQGELQERGDLDGAPGAVVVAGIDVWVVLRDEDRVVAPGDPDIVLAELETGSGADLASWRGEGLASSSDGLLVSFAEGRAVTELPLRAASVGSWSGGFVVLLADSGDLLYLQQDSIVACGGEGPFRILSLSPGGRVALADSSGTRVLIR